LPARPHPGAQSPKPAGPGQVGRRRGRARDTMARPCALHRAPLLVSGSTHILRR
jgi:hypothetical protein